MEELQDRMAYQFQNPELLRQALTHSSYTNEMTIRVKPNNERLEFLGDAVLQMVSSATLYNQYPDKPEGELTKLRAGVVCESSLARSAKGLELGRWLLLGKGLKKGNGGIRDSILSDALEAIIGAMYLDGGLEGAKAFVEAFVLSNLEEGKDYRDNKSVLQELVQGKNRGDVSYRTVGETGPDHDKTFEVEAYVGDERMGSGKGKSKKAAEQEAARQAIESLPKG